MRILAIIGFLAHIAMLALIISSCDQMDANQPEPKEPKPTVETSEAELSKDNHNEFLKYREYSLEGCQYIVVGFSNNKWGSHKGNCANPIHDK